MDKRVYQQTAIAFLRTLRRGILKAPAGAGKTYITASALHQCLERRSRPNRAIVEIMVNTREQVEQMANACNIFDIAKRCELVIYCAAGAPQDTKPDLLIVDECHHMSADSWYAKAMQCEGARWGLSATPYDDKEPEDVQRIIEVFGDQMHTIERAELVQDGHLSRAQVTWLSASCHDIGARIDAEADNLEAERRAKNVWLFKDPESERKQISQCRWQAAASIGIFDNEARDARIIGAALDAMQGGKHVIILIGKIEHGERLQKSIPGAVLCYSKMGAKRRRHAIEEFRSGAVQCLIGTSMLDEGFDAPIADCLILASAGKSARKAIQSTGRVLRPYDGKDGGVIYDMLDGFDGMLANQARKRRAIYAELNYSQK